MAFNISPNDQITDPRSQVWINFRRRIMDDPLVDVSDDITEQFKDDHLEMVKIYHDTHNTQVHSLTLINQQMDGAFEKYLESVRLKKYQWFFNNLSYFDIITLSEYNIKYLISAVNRKCKHGHSIKPGSQKEICKFIKEMRQRSIKLPAILQTYKEYVAMCVMYPAYLHSTIVYLKRILVFPIPNKYCVYGEKLQDDIIKIINCFTKLFVPLIENINCLRSDNMVGITTKNFFKCAQLIRENHYFNSYHIESLNLHCDSFNRKIEEVIGLEKGRIRA